MRVDHNILPPSSGRTGLTNPKKNSHLWYGSQSGWTTDGETETGYLLNSATSVVQIACSQIGIPAAYSGLLPGTLFATPICAGVQSNMFMVTALVQPFRLDHVRDELLATDLVGLTVSSCMGNGRNPNFVPSRIGGPDIPDSAKSEGRNRGSVGQTSRSDRRNYVRRTA